MADDLVNELANLNEQNVLKLIQERLDAGEDPMSILNDSRQGMEIVGKRFAAGEYFIPDLVYSGEILKEVTTIIKPLLTGSVEGGKRLGKIVLGTVAGDIHDIGLNIVEFMLDVNGFEVFNIGVDQPAQNFVEKIKETGAPIVGLSGFLTLAFDAMKDTVAAIDSAGLRNNLKIMIGGGQIDENVCRYTGADAYGKDAMTAVSLAKDWSGG